MKPARRRALGALAVAACSPWAARAEGGGRPLRVVASFSILADIARNVAGPSAQVGELVGPDSDAHVFEPTPAAARQLAEADLVVVNGLRYEGWLDRLVRASGLPRPGRRGQPRRRGAQARRRRRPARLAGARQRRPLRGQHGSCPRRRHSPSAQAAFAQRAAAYRARLDALDRAVRAGFAGLPRAERRVITSHESFGYFGDAYGIDFLAAQGTSTQSDPSAATVAGLADQIRRQNVRAVFVENISDPRLVERIAREGGARVGGRLYSDALSMPGTLADTYLKLYAHNGGDDRRRPARHNLRPMTLRRLLAALLLPLVLLFTQQAALRHEIQQHLGAAAGNSEQHPAPGDRCDLCLGFSQMAAAIAGGLPGHGLLGDLAFHLVDAQAPASATRELPTARSRGPPLS